MSINNQIKNQEFYENILNNVDNFTDKELNNYWGDLQSFLENISKKEVEKVKKLLLDITEKFTIKGVILGVVGFEFVLPRLGWFSQQENEKISINLMNLITNLNCEDIKFSRLVDALNLTKLNKLPNSIEILNSILDKIEEKTNEKTFSNNTSLFMILNKFIEAKGIRFKIDESTEENKKFINKLTTITQKISSKINLEINWHRQDLNEALKPTREIIEKIFESKNLNLTEKIIRSADNQNFSTKEKLQELSGGLIFHIFSWINTDNRGITNTINKNEEKAYSMFLSLQAGANILLNEIIISKLNEDEFKTLFENTNQILFNNEYFREKYMNLELISIMYFREYSSILDIISKSVDLTEDEKIDLVYRCNSFLDSISLKFEAIIRIIKSLLDKNHEIVFDTKDGSYKYRITVNKILEEIIKNEEIEKIGITGILEYLNHFLYNEKDGWRNYFGHSFKLSHFSSDNFQRIMMFWSLYVFMLALLNSFKLKTN